MIDNNTISQSLEMIFDKSSALDMLLDFENVLDTLHLYAYQNWEVGEVVDGPRISKYWVEVTLMYPASKMPDPVAARRLTRHGCKVKFKKDKYVKPGPVKPKEDIPQDSKSKAIRSSIFLVRIQMPRHFIDDFQSERLTINGTDINMDDVTSAYDTGLDQESAIQHNDSESDDEDGEIE